jgi:biopolymer transport protein ExbB
MLLELLNSSVLMYPLFAASILAFAIILERLWVLRMNRNFPKVPHAKSAAGRVLLCVNKKQMISQAKQEIHRWEQHLNMLGSIATLTPLLGLLGTVLGMITVFDVIMEEGLAEADKMAGGISEALLTTALGMSVAIIALLFYRYFNRRVDTLTLHLEAVIEQHDHA